jgi:hypothetical protein
MKLSQRTIASRTNGARSHGPKSETGKRRSSMNAVRHGLLSKSVLVSYESAEAFEALVEQHIAKLKPADNIELACVENMAAASWRLGRLMAIETRIMNQAIDKSTEETEFGAIAEAFQKLSAGPELHLIDRYERRLNRAYQRSLQNLLLLRQFESPDDAPSEPEVEKPAPVPPPPEPVRPNEPESPQPPAKSTAYTTLDRLAFILPKPRRAVPTDAGPGTRWAGSI